MSMGSRKTLGLVIVVLMSGLLGLVLVSLIRKVSPSPGPDDLHRSLFKAVAARDVVTISNLVGMGADPNVQHPYFFFGWTPLIMATYFEYPEVVESLLSLGADIKRRDGLGKTALNYAISADNTNVARILLEHGAVHCEDTQALLGMVACKSSSNIWRTILEEYLGNSSCSKGIGR